MLLVLLIVYTVSMGRSIMWLSTKKGNYYGFLNNENYPSVEQFVADLSRTGMRFKDNTIVSLTNRLIPDRYG